jgi:hypothetical protein
MQAEKVQAGMQEILPGRAHGETLHRGRWIVKGRCAIRGIMHWLWNLREKVPVCRDYYCQFAD